MPNLTDISQWDAGVYEFQTTDPVQGGPGGIDNQPHQNLANRALWLRNRMKALISQAGIVEGTADNTQLAQCVVLHVGTIAALRLCPIPVVPGGLIVRILVSGKATSNDGGGQLYQWNASDATADNGSTIIRPSSNPATGRWNLCGLNATQLGGQAANLYALQTTLVADVAALNSSINNEATLRTNADNAESLARSNAITAANAAIAAETAARVAAISTEAGTRNSVDVSLSNSISSETTTRISAINAEASARVAGDLATLNSAEDFAAPGSHLASPGYRQNADGSIDMWGVVANGGLGPTAVTFPTIPGNPSPGFPTAALNLLSQCFNGQGTISQTSLTKTGFTSTNGATGSSTMWHAIGF